jgi:2-polyprenyl-3-methyl-5-hydroxy-6-metoxy-1,4-benzoquinol methylase
VYLNHNINNEFLKFCDTLREEDCIDFIAKHLCEDTEGTAAKLEHFIAEAFLTLDLIKDCDLENLRILEVGAGAGLLAAQLEMHGLNVYSIEPIDPWFNALSEYLQLDKNRRLGISIEDLDPNSNGLFDLIISNNVLEHVADFKHCLMHLSKQLSPNGVMVHNLPNYVIPFEPHYCIPLIPIVPSLTRYFIPRKWKESDLWKSFNFATYFQARSSARVANGEVIFRKGLLAKQFVRLRQDKEFARRHGWLKVISQVIIFFRIDFLLAHLPPWSVTPMVIEWRNVLRH